MLQWMMTEIPMQHAFVMSYKLPKVVESLKPAHNSGLANVAIQWLEPAPNTQPLLYCKPLCSITHIRESN